MNVFLHHCQLFFVYVVVVVVEEYAETIEKERGREGTYFVLRLLSPGLLEASHLLEMLRWSSFSAERLLNVSNGCSFRTRTRRIGIIIAISSPASSCH